MSFHDDKLLQDLASGERSQVYETFSPLYVLSELHVLVLILRCLFLSSAVGFIHLLQLLVNSTRIIVVSLCFCFFFVPSSLFGGVSKMPI